MSAWATGRWPRPSGAGAIDLTPNLKREVAFRAASHYLAVGDTDAALSAMMMLEKHLPDDLDLVHSICSLHREAGRYADALPYARTLAVKGQNFGNFLNTGIVLSGLGLYEESLSAAVSCLCRQTGRTPGAVRAVLVRRKPL